MKFDVLIPAYNEADAIYDIVQMFKDCKSVSKVIVIDNNSIDDTAKLASSAGAVVHREQRVGKGFALKTGFQYTEQQTIFVCDADIRGLSPEKTERLVYPVFNQELEFCRASINRGFESAPITNLVALPLLSILFPDLKDVREPLGGIFAIRRDTALELEFPGDWGVDVSITLELHLHKKAFREIFIPDINHRKKDLISYAKMSQDVIRAILNKAGSIKTL